MSNNQLFFEYIPFFIMAYLFGSVPFGLIFSRLMGIKNLREHGSGNIGATNALRVGGKKLGIATLMADALKGFMPVFLSKNEPELLTYMISLCAILGHIFPIWLKFKGGKGIATAFGITFAIDWHMGIIAAIVWLSCFSLSRYSSLSSIFAFAFLPLYAYYNNNNYLSCFALLLLIIILITHRQNIMRLVSGTENKFNNSSKK